MTIRNPSYRKRVFPLLIVGLLVFLMYRVSENTTSYTLYYAIAQAGDRGWIVLILLKIATVVFAPISGTVIYVVSGAVYGVTTSLLLISIGNILGISCSFRIARTYGHGLLRYLLDEKSYEKVSQLVARIGTHRGFLFLRVVLFPIEDIINYAAGLTKISYLYFLVVSMICTTVYSLIFIFFGEAIFRTCMIFC